MKRFTAVICILLLLFASACAEGQRILFSGPGQDILKVACLLPRGRALLLGRYQGVACLVCLDAEGAEVWRYDAPEGGYVAARLGEQNVIDVLWGQGGSEEKPREQLGIRHFTLDGQPTGEYIPLPQADGLLQATEKCILVEQINDDDATFTRTFYSWEGVPLFRFDSETLIGDAMTLLSGGEGTVLYSNETGYPYLALILEVDQTGQPLWQTVIPGLNSENSNRLEKCIRLSDGGYLGFLCEWNEGRECALVRLDRTGRILWLNRQAFEGLPVVRCEDMCEYGGRLVVAVASPEWAYDVPDQYLWFDGEGHRLGVTETAHPQNEASFGPDLLPTESGLWGLVMVGELRSDGRIDTAQADTVLLRVPEP